MVEDKLTVEGNIVIVVEGGVVNTVFYNGQQQTATIVDYDVEGRDSENYNLKVIDGEDAEILSIETEHMSEEFAKQLGFEHLSGGRAEVLASHKGYDIVRYYANVLNEGGEHLLYGDIYSSRSQVILNHPGATIAVGYGLVDPFTGFHLSDAPDWFETIADVIYYIDELEVVE